MNGVAWAEGPEHPRARTLPVSRIESPDTPVWASRAVLAIATVAAFAVIGSPLGLGLTVVLIAFGVVAARVPKPIPTVDLRERPAPAGRWRLVWWALAAGLASVPVFRAAPWVVVPSVLAAAALASLAVGGGRAWGELVAGLSGLWARLPFGAVLVATAAGSVRGRGAALRGALLAAGIVAVFLPLLMSADAAFSEVLQHVVPNLDRPVERALGLVCFATAGGALVYTAARPLAPATVPPARRTLSRLEWALPLGALVALLGAFVALQLATLFGGRTHVLATAGLTYAEYARSGFAQLLAVAALTLAVVAAARRWAPGSRPLLAVLCLLTLVVLASSLKRLGLYEAEYGFTRLRFAAHATLLWLGAIFLLILIATPGHLPRATLAVTGATVLLFALADPDRTIAEHNLQRYERTGRIDRLYLQHLSADAGLSCPRPDGVSGYNLARERARKAC